MIFLSWLHRVTSHVCESCGDARVRVGHGFIVPVGCLEEAECSDESRAFGAVSIEECRRVSSECSVGIHLSGLGCWLRLSLLLSLLRWIG